MASLQIELERSQSGCDIEGMQQLQHELKEKCADRQKMRQIFDTVKILFNNEQVKIN